jgi:ubiquinone/menaquinone biosynthesis C-methylase UbiE
LQSDNSLTHLLGQTDIYLIDQILKDRYRANDKILDAGCGPGRNMHWFLQNNFEITGIDQNDEAISQLRSVNPGLPENRFRVVPVEKMPFPDHYFDHVISSAVLHFATGTGHFRNMLKEMVRVLHPGGSLFIRMTSDIGIEEKVSLASDGVFDIPDGSRRFLLTRTLLNDCMKEFNLSFLEPLKTVNVDDIRCMSTLVLQKK